LTLFTAWVAQEELVQAINCTLVPGQRADTSGEVLEGDLAAADGAHLGDGSNVYISTGGDDEELFEDDVHIEL
jgi:hypothetical protein